jgi:hypothetical protein
VRDPISEQLDLLLQGYGFNYYRIENRPRADDLLVRQKVGTSLGHASARLEQLIQQFQHGCIPAPTRQQPYPSAELMDRLTALRALRQRVMEQNAFLQGMPAPAQDKIWCRLRDEEGLLRSLLHADIAMLQLAADVEREVQMLSCDRWKSADAGNAMVATLDRWDAAVRARQELLRVQV